MQQRRPDLLPLIVLGVIALLAVLGWLLFPTLQHYIAFQDCAAAGRVDCSLPGKS